MSWNIWLTGIYRKNGETAYKEVFANGSHFDDNGKYHLVTSDPNDGEIDLLAEFDDMDISLLPDSIKTAWNLDKENYYQVKTISAKEYLKLCYEIINDYHKQCRAVSQALGVEYYVDSEFPDDNYYHPSEKVEKEKLTFQVSKELFADLNEKRSRYEKAVRMSYMCEVLIELAAQREKLTWDERKDLEVNLLFIAG